MPEQPKEPSGPKDQGPIRREDRLAAALRANLARRKAQARQRAATPAAPEKPEATDR